MMRNHIGKAKVDSNFTNHFFHGPCSFSLKRVHPFAMDAYFHFLLWTIQIIDEAWQEYSLDSQGLL